MKKSLLILTLFAAVLAGCSSEEPIVNGGDNESYDQANSFITIKMRTADAINMGGRAADPDPTNGTYENGTANENNVSRVRFYFFNSSGVAFGVHRNTASGTYDSYIDWYPTDSDIPNPYPGAGGNDNPGTPGGNGSVVDDETVEKVMTATLGINLKDTESCPAQVLAVINPTNAVLNLPNGDSNEENINGPSLEQIRGVVTDYLTGLTNNNFVMSNSVYVDNNEIVYATPLSEDNFASTPAAAAASPVIIYVERVLARLDLGFADAFFESGITPEGKDFKIFKAGDIEVRTTTTTEGADGETTTTSSSYDQAVYVKFLGWNVTTTTNMSRLVKDIDKSWGTYAILGDGMIWNTADYHRSFWAINPNTTTFPNFGYQYGTFNVPSQEVADNVNIATALAFPTEKGKYTVTYLQENAAPFESNTEAPVKPSQVIIGAQLVNAQGEPLTIAQWGYNYYTMEGLTNQLANVLNQLYSVTTSTNGEKVYTRIQPADLAFQYQDPIGSQSTDKNYWVYAVLNTKVPAGSPEGTVAAAQRTWQLGKSADTTPFADAAAVNNYIRDMVNHVMIWETGNTYYYFDIRHLGVNNEVPGYVGVVRNHIYRSTITSVAGLGVPVYDPDQTIIPETQGPDDAVIAAEIRILQWRVVSQGYDLKWE